jgi:hypothetical protein
MTMVGPAKAIGRTATSGFPMESQHAVAATSANVKISNTRNGSNMYPSRKYKTIIEPKNGK